MKYLYKYFVFILLVTYAVSWPLHQHIKKKNGCIRSIRLESFFCIKIVNSFSAFAFAFPIKSESCLPTIFFCNPYALTSEKKRQTLADKSSAPLTPIFFLLRSKTIFFSGVCVSVCVSVRAVTWWVNCPPYTHFLFGCQCMEEKIY